MRELWTLVQWGKGSTPIDFSVQPLVLRSFGLTAPECRPSKVRYLLVDTEHLKVRTYPEGFLQIFIHDDLVGK